VLGAALGGDGTCLEAVLGAALGGDGTCLEAVLGTVLGGDGTCLEAVLGTVLGGDGTDPGEETGEVGEPNEPDTWASTCMQQHVCYDLHLQRTASTNLHSTTLKTLKILIMTMIPRLSRFL
jgi:hypothetical protein